MGSRKKTETRAEAAARAGKPASRAASGGKASAPSSSAGKQRGAGATARAAAAKPRPKLPSAGKSSPKPAGLERGAKAAAKRVPAPKAARPASRARAAKGRAAVAPVVKAKAGVAKSSKKAAAPVAPKSKARAVETTGAKGLARVEAGAPHAVADLNEEDQIRAAKYLPRELPKRIFEEDRFIFPETYGVNRIRLLVRDPEWIFAYWDVSPAAMKDFAKSIGERALALSRLTLRVVDPVSGGSTDILLPPGARWWYVRTDASRRTYRAELGVTLPSGEFRRLAESNTVVTPRVGPSPDRARRRMSYPDARELPLSAAAAASEAEKRSGVALEPWAPGAVEGAEAPGASGTGKAGTGGASDTFRPGGASDAFPGASDTFRR